jgi:hypothetical protein
VAFLRQTSPEHCLVRTRTLQHLLPQSVPVLCGILRRFGFPSLSSPSQDPSYLYVLTTLESQNSNSRRGRLAYGQTRYDIFPYSGHTFELTQPQYGSFYAPATLAYFQKQDVAKENGSLHGSVNLPLDTLGITNGCVDTLYFSPSYPSYSFNNTYGVQLIPQGCV